MSNMREELEGLYEDMCFNQWHGCSRLRKILDKYPSQEDTPTPEPRDEETNRIRNWIMDRNICPKCLEATVEGDRDFNDRRCTYCGWREENDV